MLRVTVTVAELSRPEFYFFGTHRSAFGCLMFLFSPLCFIIEIVVNLGKLRANKLSHLFLCFYKDVGFADEEVEAYKYALSQNGLSGPLNYYRNAVLPDAPWGLLRAHDCKYPESLARLKKSKILVICQKNTFGELSSKKIFSTFKNL